jgi:hypothetical protein
MPRSNKKKSWKKPPQKAPTEFASSSHSFSSESGLMKFEKESMISIAIGSRKKHGIDIFPGRKNLALQFIMLMTEFASKISIPFQLITTDGFGQQT